MAIVYVHLIYCEWTRIQMVIDFICSGKWYGSSLMCKCARLFFCSFFFFCFVCTFKRFYLIWLSYELHSIFGLRSIFFFSYYLYEFVCNLIVCSFPFEMLVDNRLWKKCVVCNRIGIKYLVNTCEKMNFIDFRT